MSQQRHRAGRAPDTPTTSKDDSDDKADLSDLDTPDPDEIPVGRRFTDNPDILRLEREMIAEGVELGNRAVPINDHPEKHDYEAAAEIRDEIAAEASKDYPNKERIGVLNQILNGMQS